MWYNIIKKSISPMGIILVIGNWLSFHLVLYNSFKKDYWHMDWRFFKWCGTKDLIENKTRTWLLLNKIMKR